MFVNLLQNHIINNFMLSICHRYINVYFKINQNTLIFFINFSSIIKISPYFLFFLDNYIFFYPKKIKF